MKRKPRNLRCSWETEFEKRWKDYHRRIVLTPFDKWYRDFRLSDSKWIGNVVVGEYKP